MAERDVEAVLFDLDGTLIDSIDLILRSYRHTLQVHGKSEADDDYWRRGLGTPLRTQLEPYGSSEEEVDALVATFRTWNLANHDELVTPYPGALAAVEDLQARGLRLGVVTSKVGSSARRGLALCGFEGLMEVVVGADDVTRHKPDPAPILFALERLGVGSERALYVGDSPHDIHAGARAGAGTAAALWGPFERAELELARPDVWLERPSQIAALA